jgi:FimV-like protein
MFIDHNMLTKIIFISVLMILAVVMMFIVKKARNSKKQALEKIAIQKVCSLSLVDEFSGDNHCDTELDLAKAYIELRQNEKAKYLLKSVVSNGNPHQIAEARKMFMLILKQDREMKSEDAV